MTEVVNNPYFSVRLAVQFLKEMVSGDDRRKTRGRRILCHLQVEGNEVSGS